MKYITELTGFDPDELIGGLEETPEIINVQVDSAASISRGDLICAASMSSIFAPVESAEDASKILMIAANDFTADSLHTVTQAYSGGKFNREKITFGGASLSLLPFEAELRKQNIIVTSLK